MTIPSELLRSIPREIKLTAAGKIAAVTAAVLFLASVVVSGWLLATSLRADARAEVAVTATARIVRLTVTRGEHPRWNATYAYEAGGRSFEATRRLGRVDRERLSLGDTIPIRYLPADPETHWLEGDQGERIPVVVAPVAFLSFAAGGVAIIFGTRRQMSLLSNGRPAIARVTGSRRIKGGTHGKRDVQRVAYEFRLLSGAVRTGRFETPRAAPQTGSEIVVLYDPDNPKRSRKYPLSLVKCITP